MELALRPLGRGIKLATAYDVTVPPPLPIYHSPLLRVLQADEQISIESTGELDVLRHQSELAELEYESLWIPVHAIVDVAVRDHARDTALVRIGGCFHQQAIDDDESLTERFVGPLPTTEATTLARALAQALSLPRVPVTIMEESLRADPARFHRQVVQVTGTWTTGFEASEFAGCWLSPPLIRMTSHGATTRSIVGLVIAEGAHGHFGRYSAELLAYTMDPPI